MSQLAKLATPFQDKFIETKPGKFAAAYVPHGIVTQFLLGIVGAYDFSIDDVVTVSYTHLTLPTILLV